MRSYDITRVRWIRALLISRWPQVAIASVTLAGFTVAILAGLVGTRQSAVGTSASSSCGLPGGRP